MTKDTAGLDGAGNGSRVFRKNEALSLLGLDEKKFDRVRRLLTIAPRRDKSDHRRLVFTWAEIAEIAKHVGRSLPNVDTDLSLNSLDERVRRLEGEHRDLVYQVEHIHDLLGVPAWPALHSREAVSSVQYPPVDEVEEMIRRAISFVRSLPTASAPLDSQIVLTLRNSSEAFSYLSLVGAEWYAELAKAARRGWTIVHLIQRPKTRDQAGKLVEVMIRMLRIAPASYKPKIVAEDLEAQVLARELALLPGIGIVEMRSTRKRRIPDEAILISPVSSEYGSLCATLRIGVEKASDALKLYSWPEVQFCEAIADIEGIAGHHGLVMEGLSSLTVPLDIHRARLENWEGTSENLARARNIVASYERREENFMNNIARWTCRDICSTRAIEDYVRDTGLHAKDDILWALGARTFLPSERELHIRHVIGMLTKKRYHKRYQLGLISDDTLVDPRVYRTFWMFKSDRDIAQSNSTPSPSGCRVLLEAYETQADGRPQEIDLEIEDPWIVHAFQELFERLWQQTEHRPAAVIRWLRNLIV